MKPIQLKDNLYWVGVQDKDLKVFDIVMKTEYGSSYNAYMLKGSEKTALFETAKAEFMSEFINKLDSVAGINNIDYIIVNHTEPDHAGSAKTLIEKNPAIKLVGSATAISFMKEICNMDFNSIIVKPGDRLSLGDKTLHFIAATNLHWPDAMFTYVEEDKVLFSCDSFGAHYSFEPLLISKMSEKDKPKYLGALKFYFDIIMSPFKSFMLKAIASLKDLQIDMICPGHGPVLDKNPWDSIKSSEKWATEENPNTKKTVIIPYVSAYGYTKKIADKIQEGINDAGDFDIRSYDMVDADKKKVLDDLYWADGILLGTPTILGDALEPIWDLTTAMVPCVHGGKIASAFGSYGWSGEGVPNIMKRLEMLRMKTYNSGLKIRFNPSEADLEEAYQYGYEFGVCVDKGRIVSSDDIEFPSARAWKCMVCGVIEYGVKPPAACPVCGVGPEQFIAVEE